MDVVIADNGTGDGCRALIESRFPEVRRVGFGRNLGFGPALNRAIATHGDGPIVLLNDDARASPDFVERLLVASEDAEMTAAVMVDHHDETRIDSAGVIVDQTLMGFDYLNGHHVDVLKEAEVPLGPTGGGALYSRDAFVQVGGFDERIFLYFEDVDLAVRIRSIGGRCALAADALASHAYSETLGACSPQKYAMTGWSRGYLLRKYGIMRNWKVAAGALVQETVVCGGQILRDHTTAGLRGRMRGWSAFHGEPSTVPPATLTEMSTVESLGLRLRRRRS